MADSLTIKDIKAFFGYPTLAAFSADWKALPDEDKKQIRQGLLDGTFNY